MGSTYNKPHLSFQQQLELLKARGLEVTDDVAALAYLSRIGYYRLSAYWYPLRLPLITQDPVTQKITVTRLDQFKPEIKFEHVLSMYVFDKRPDCTSRLDHEIQQGSRTFKRGLFQALQEQVRIASTHLGVSRTMGLR
jgi:abortive infection bacteriophage resistance protein